MKWLSVPGCENITDTQCNFSSIISTSSGIYYLRVQAMSEYNKSCVSNEIKVDPLITSKQTCFLNFSFLNKLVSNAVICQKKLARLMKQNT